MSDLGLPALSSGFWTSVHIRKTKHGHAIFGGPCVRRRNLGCVTTCVLQVHDRQGVSNGCAGLARI